MAFTTVFNTYGKTYNKIDKLQVALTTLQSTVSDLQTDLKVSEANIMEAIQNKDVVSYRNEEGNCLLWLLCYWRLEEAALHLVDTYGTSCCPLANYSAILNL